VSSEPLLEPEAEAEIAPATGTINEGRGWAPISFAPSMGRLPRSGRTLFNIKLCGGNFAVRELVDFLTA